MPIRTVAAFRGILATETEETSIIAAGPSQVSPNCIFVLWIEKIVMRTANDPRP